MLLPPEDRCWDLRPEQLAAPLPLDLPEGVSRYQAFTPLGTGGKAEVFLCRDTVLGRQVAYKVLRHELLSDASEQQSLVREARLMAGLSHPLIPRVYEIGRDANHRPYFTMDHCPGVNLHRLLDRLRRKDRCRLVEYPLECRIHLLLQIVDAISHAHRRGVIHGDLKPSNLMIGAGPTERASVIDWGLACLAGEQLAEHPLDQPAKGSPLYMSPEQVSDRHVRPTFGWDVYGLGAVLYECLTLRPLVSGTTITEVLHNVVDETPVAPIDCDPTGEVTVTLSDVCLRAVAKSPGERYADVGQLHAALRDAHLDLLVQFDRDLDCGGYAPESSGGILELDLAAPDWGSGTTVESSPDRTPTAAELENWWALQETDRGPQRGGSGERRS
jgi:serine/threonine protein kinase